jgi:hypothetical protein
VTKDQYGRELIPCRICGEPTAMLGTKECDWCHGVTFGLPHVLKSEAGRDFVRKALAAAEASS